MSAHPEPVEISAYLDGEQPAAVMREIGAHVRVCEPCRKVADELQGAIVAVQELESIDVPLDFSREVLSRLAPGARARRWAAIAASLIFSAATLLIGLPLVVLGLLHDPDAGRRLGATSATAVETAFSMLRSIALIGRIGWSLILVLLRSAAQLMLSRGPLLPLALAVLAAGLAYLLSRSLDTYYRRSRLA